MPDQVVPITDLASTGVILDTPPVSLPPNAFTNVRNVRFKDGAVRKMEGEVDIFAGVSALFTKTVSSTDPRLQYGELQYIAWWPSPNQTVQDAGYYVFVMEDLTDSSNTVHRIFAMLPGATAAHPTPMQTFNDLTLNGLADISPTAGYGRQGKWQHTLFNGGFTFIINNGVEKPQYITDPEGNLDITMLELNDLPGWDSYEVNEILLRDTFTTTSSNIFDTGQTRVSGVTQYVVTRTRSAAEVILTETTTVAPAVIPMDEYRITQENGQDTITFGTGTLSAATNDEVQVNFQSVNPVSVSAAIVRAFGAFLVAGNLVERDSVTNGNPIVRRLTGVVRSSDVAQPGAIPNNWNPFAAGVSTADEFVIADTGTVQDMVALQGNLYLYTNTSISVMRPTGNATVPLAVQPVTDQYGALTTDAVLEYDGKHFVIGSDDIYLFGGHPGSIQSISDQKVRRTFFTTVNPINENTRNLFTLRYAARDEIWVCFPTVNSTRGECNEAYIWNYRNGTWTIRTLNSVISGNIAPVPGGGVPSAILSFTGDSGTDDIIQVGSQEVQTINVSADATVGHAASGRAEIQNFATARSLASIDRPAITTNSNELAEIAIGTDVFAGPNPTLEVAAFPPQRNFTYAVNHVNGGARLTGTYTDQGRTNPTRTVTIDAEDIFMPSELVNHTGNGDTASVVGAAPYTDSTFRVSSTQVPETSQPFSGSSTSNPTGNLVTTSRAFDNDVSNSNANGTGVDVTTSPGGSFAFNGSGSSTQTVTSQYTTAPRNSNGSVTVSMTAVNTMMNVQTPGQTVTFGGGNTERRPTAAIIYPQVPAGMSIVLNGVTIPGGTRLTPLQTTQLIGDPNSTSTNLVSYFANPRGSPRPNVRGRYFVSESGTGRVSLNPFRGAISFTISGNYRGWLGFNRGSGFVSASPSFARSTSCWYRGTSTNAGFERSVGRTVPTGSDDNGNPTFTGATTSWSFGEPIPNVNDFTSLSDIVVGNVTASVPTVVQTVRLNSITNNTNASISFAWAGGTRTVNAGQTLSVNQTIQGTNQAWSFSGTAQGTNYSNNSSFEIADFTGGNTGNSGTLNAFTAIDRAILNSTAWTGHTARLTVTNNNPISASTDPRLMGREGRINFTTTSDTDVPEFPGAGTSRTFLDHNNSWSYSGIRSIQLEGTRIDLTRTGGQPVRNVRFVVNPSGLTSQTEAVSVLSNNGIVSTTFPVDFSAFPTNYAWEIVGATDPRSGETLQNSTVTGGQFNAAVIEAINADRITSIPSSEWTAQNIAGNIRLVSDLPGQRTFNSWTYTTHDETSTLTTDSFIPAISTQGIGDVVPLASQLPVSYVFSNSEINLMIEIPLERDTVDNASPTNAEIETRIVTALRANSTFNQYYTVRDHNDDAAIALGRFDLIARALPGAAIPGTSLTMPMMSAIFSAINLQFGGNAALSAGTVPGVATADAPVIVMIETSQPVFNSMNGTRTTDHTTIATHLVTLSGSYPSTATDDNRINEQFRQLFRNAPFSDTWNVTAGDTLNPATMQITSVNNNDLLNTVTTPTMTALAPYLQFETTQEGLGGRGTVYPTIRLTPPTSEVTTDNPHVDITLTPDNSVTGRLTNLNIAEIMRTQFSFPGWSVQTGANPITRSGTGVAGNMVKLVKTTPAEITEAWTVSVLNYGDIGNTLSGTAEAADGLLIGRLNADDFTLPAYRTTNNLVRNLDFRGRREERSNPTRVIVEISNADLPGGIQYIPFSFGGTGAYDPTDQTPTGRGTRVDATTIVNTIQSGITNANRRISTTITGNTLTLLPSQYSGLASFILRVAINNDDAGVTLYNQLADLNNAIDGNTMIERIDTFNNGGRQSTVPPQVVAGNNSQADPNNVNRVPNFLQRNALDPNSNPSDDIVTVASSINTVFDPLRPWPTTQVNLNREYPVFVTAILDANTGDLTQHFRGADIGFLNLTEQYESFIERIEMAITPEFDTEQIQALALWGDGGSIVTFGQPDEQAILDVKMYGTNNPGETLGQFSTRLISRSETTNRLDTEVTTDLTAVDNKFLIGQDYKIDMRIHGRFLNLLISDFDVSPTGARTPNANNRAMDTSLNVQRGISWNISGMQADIVKGGRR